MRLIITIFLMCNIYSSLAQDGGRFIFQVAKQGKVSKKYITEQNDEISKIKEEYESKQKEWNNALNNQKKQTEFWQKKYKEQLKITAEMQTIIEQLKQERDDIKTEYNILLDKYFALYEELTKAHGAIQVKNTEMMILRYKFDQLVLENDNLRKKLAQTPPKWQSGSLKKRKDFKNAYDFLLNVNTTNIGDYLDQIRKKNKDAYIIAKLDRVETDKGYYTISDLGNGLFLSTKVSVGETSDLKFHFRSDERLRKSKEIYPIVIFYLVDGNKEEQLGIIDNIKISYE